MTNSDRTTAGIESPTVSLADFLLARIAEDEAVAVAAGESYWREVNIGQTLSKRADPADEPKWIIDSDAVLVSYEVTDEHKAHHVARHDPERVLAECEAKRRIVFRYTDAEACALDEDHDPDALTACAWRGQGIFEVLHDLALPYADHPDYRDEWRG